MSHLTGSPSINPTVTPAMPLGCLSREEFLRDYWRQKPLLARAGARTLSLNIEESAFLRLAETLETLHPHLVRRSPDGTVFAQNLDIVSKALRAVSESVGRSMSWPSVWFDGVLTQTPGGVGPHWDASDNFVLQQVGSKTWRLHSPDIIPPNELHQIMTGALVEPTPVIMPSDSLEFTLNAGDLLYIPLFWPHSGTSHGASLSLSLVSNAENALTLLPLVFWVLSEEQAWWRPLPVIQPDAGPSLVDTSATDRLFEQLFAVFQNPVFRARLKAEWWLARQRRLLE